MNLSASSIFIFTNFLILFDSISAILIAIPTENLLGPEVCPTGSFCTETSSCDAYYTTNSGLPFYCGPHKNINSKICCIETESTLRSASLDHNELELDKSNLSNATDDDDEVDILSLPYATDNVDDAHFYSESIYSSPDDGLERPIGDLESMLEDAIEQDLSSPQSSQNVRETGFRTTDGQHQQPQQNHFNQAYHAENAFQDHDQAVNVDPRTQHNYESHQQRAFTCPCEKGEKGDPGPKGEPGEPGKIIYIPVFVNTVASSGNVAPLQFSSSQANMNHQGQVPQHPNPTVVPFNVPVNIPSAVPPPIPTGTLMPQQQHQSTPHPHQPIYNEYQQYPTQASPQVQQQQPPSPSTPTFPSYSIPHSNDDMQARLSRNTNVNDHRFANRRY